jgi:hypothetical protein
VGWWLRRLAFVATAALTVWLLWDYVGSRFQLRRDIRAAEADCGLYLDPADRVVLDTGSETAAALLRLPGYEADAPALLRQPGHEVDDYGTVGSTLLPQQVRRLYATRRAEERWHELREMPTSGGGLGGLFGSGPSRWRMERFVAFAHRLATGPGSERLVIVRPTSNRAESDGSIGFEAAVLPLTGWLGSYAEVAEVVAVVPDTSGSPVDLVLQPTDQSRGVRLLAGRLDANDPSRFAIAYEMDGRRGTVCGQLLPDETIRWTVLDH